MRTIICGMRDFFDREFVTRAIEHCPWTITHGITGGARGVDTIAKQWLDANNVPNTVIDAEWNRLGKRAGPVRNRHMADVAEAVLAIWDGKSTGTGDMINVARRTQINSIHCSNG